MFPCCCSCILNLKLEEACQKLLATSFLSPLLLFLFLQTENSLFYTTCLLNFVIAFATNETEVETSLQNLFCRII